MGSNSGWLVRFVAAGLAVGLGVAAQVSPSSAQCGPYGCPPPPLPGSDFPPPTCVLSSPSAETGSAVRADIGNVPIGMTVELRVAGRPAGSQTATTPRPGSEPPVADLSFPFVAPTEPGTYEVAAVGPAFQAVCPGGLEVLASQRTRQPVARGSGEGALALTGTEIGLLVALGIALLVVGRWLYVEARRRRRTVRPLELASTRVRREDAG